MGNFLSSNALSGGLVANDVPTISYAYSKANTASFGADMSFFAYDSNGPRVFGQVTPYLVNPDPAIPKLACTPFSVYSQDQSLKCPTAATSMLAGLYTISLSQFQSTTSYAPGASTADTYAIGNIETSVSGGATFSIAATVTATEASTTVTGTTEILPTATSTVPSSYTTVTAYYTTIVSTVVSSQIAGGKPIKTTVTAACPAPKCNHNNCYRGILAKSAEASEYCANFDVATAAAPFPTYVSKCDKKPASIASACSCVFSTMSARGLDGRGIVAVPVYTAPDFTLLSGTVYTFTETPTITIPAATVTDPAATISSGVSTSTIYVDSTVTITTVISNIGAATTTITKKAKDC